MPRIFFNRDTFGGSMGTFPRKRDILVCQLRGILAFDPKGDGRQRIYGGIGFFYDIMKYSLPRGSFGGDVWKEYFYTMDDPNLVNTNQGFTADPTKLPGRLIEVVDYRIPSNDPSKHLIDPNLKPMKQRMIDLGYDYSLTSGLVTSAPYTDRRLLSAIEDIGYVSPDGEVYNIGNPGHDIAADPQNWLKWMGPGNPTTPKAVRDYDAVELRLDKRFSRKYQFSASYTGSQLYGNYSGLASSDEGGRDNPDNTRYFDQPWIYGDSHGGMRWACARQTPPDLQVLRRLYAKEPAGSDHAVSKHLLVLGYAAHHRSTGDPVPRMGVLIGSGDMGRAPFFYQFDMNLLHDFAPLRNHESVKVRLEATVFNLLNSSIITDRYSLLSHTVDGAINVDNISGIFTQSINAQTLMQAQGIRTDPQYGLANGFQARALCVPSCLYFSDMRKLCTVLCGAVAIGTFGDCSTSFAPMFGIESRSPF